MTEVFSFIGASLSWFTPLAAVRVYENGYGLGYTEVNMSVLTMTLLFIPCLSFIYMIHPYP